ncbi:heavy metal translocating P-type ATPase [Sinorhizobium alkalisoli]|uniref:heavy metal translocating P-type ATPase n=1 Tax=Sinorhizobium alkalisoli TaxID=1752398 RepID=UPI00124F5C12|nr:cation-translocating P-type ATPase [Sinorhizobium alkalisoli]QFI68588.1 Lead, cadmium, zinc and mercury transporting ATPase [Sinorhizobium alkalisoli]
MSGRETTLCSHCLLPAGRRPVQYRLEGKDHAFCCYGCRIAYEIRHGRGEESEAAWLLVRIGVGAFLSMNIMLLSLLVYTGTFAGPEAHLLPWIHALMWLFATPAVLILGGPFLGETLRGAAEGRLTSSALIVIGVAAAYLYSAFAVLKGENHVYFDTASMVLMLFTLGRYLEAESRAKAARDLEPLLAAETATATIVANGIEMRRPVGSVATGMLVRVRPGELVPVDGIVVDGESSVDEAMITGESRPVTKTVGFPVIAGSINFDGPLLVKCSGAGTDTRWAHICRSVRDALSRQCPTQRIADRIVSLAVPIVLVSSGFTIAYWAQSQPLDRALITGLAVLVVACPCAVGLAAPLATTLGIGRLARRGCLVRDPGLMETLATLRCVAFDKTGTLTVGRPQVTGIDTDGASEEDVLTHASGLERYSEHALAKAVTLAAVERGIRPPEAMAVRVDPGRGIRGVIGEQPVAVGNEALMRDLGWSCPPPLRERARRLGADGCTLVHVGWNGRVHGVLALDDTPRQEAQMVVDALKDRGSHLALLTGDGMKPAQRVAAAVGIDEIEASLSPEAKRVALARIRRRHGTMAMVGDGLNDGPVLADADVGIAVGSATDLAREAAALTLPDGGLWMLPWVIDIARAVRRTILTNLLWAFGYNLVALTAAALGLLQPILAAAVMAGSSLLVVMNSLRLARVPDPDPVFADRQPRDDQDAPPKTSAVKAEYQPIA